MSLNQPPVYLLGGLMRTYQQSLFDQQPIRPDRATLKQAILAIIDHEQPLKARQIAYRLSRRFGVDIPKHDVNSIVYRELRRVVQVLQPEYVLVRIEAAPRPALKQQPLQPKRPAIADNAAVRQVIVVNEQPTHAQSTLRYLLPLGYLLLSIEILRGVL
jgi:hypothetical protein